MSIKVTTKFAMILIISLTLLIIIACAFALDNPIGAENGMQIVVTMNQENPHFLTISAHMNVWNPPFASLKNEQLSCDGVGFPFSVPYVYGQTFAGFSAEVPVATVPSSYQCYFQNWSGKRMKFQIPAPSFPSIIFQTSLQKNMTFPLNQSFDVAYTSNNGSPATQIQALDKSGHLSISTSSSYGSSGGTAHFDAVEKRGLMAGSGEIQFINQVFAPTIQEPGWNYISIIYRNAMSIPVTWT